MASGAALLDQNSIFCSATLHVVGTWYDPTTCKVLASRMGEKTLKKKATFDHCVCSQAAGGAQAGQNVAQNWILFGYLGRSQAPASFPNGQNVGIQPFVLGDTLHVVGSWHDPATSWHDPHDPATCKLSASRTKDKPFGTK
jgi:hypothetical protein